MSPPVLAYETWAGIQDENECVFMGRSAPTRWATFWRTYRSGSRSFQVPCSQDLLILGSATWLAKTCPPPSLHSQQPPVAGAGSSAFPWPPCGRRRRETTGTRSPAAIRAAVPLLGPRVGAQGGPRPPCGCTAENKHGTRRGRRADDAMTKTARLSAEGPPRELAQEGKRRRRACG